MNIIKADTLGYCMGVRRAVESATIALKEFSSDKTVYSLGALIHNPIALAELTEQGLVIIQENQINQIKKQSVVIIRAHGVSPEIKDFLKSKNVIIIDSTCPRVTVSQSRVAEFSENGYIIILAGDKGHAEVEGIKGYCKTDFFCIENLQEAKDLICNKIQPNQKCLLLCQTTFSLNEFLNIAEFLKTKIFNLKVINTICPATKQRQESLERLCKIVDGIIVVGGKKSANTIRLFQKASDLLKKENKNPKNAIHIENSSEIPKSFLTLKSVGVTAGASTPDNVIDDVIDRLNQL